MAEEEIRIPFNRHKLDALKVALYTAGKDFDREIADLLEQFYIKNVSAQERLAVEKQIRKDETAEKEEMDQFVVIKLKSGKDVVCLTASGSNDLYFIAGQCRVMLKDADENTLDTLAQYFIDRNFMDDRLYDVIVNAQSNHLLKAVVELNFNNCILTIKERGATQPICYQMEDLEKAHRNADTIPNISQEKRDELFRKYLHDREFEIAETEDMKPMQL